ncbi:hypothetical protein [Oscillatoria sp. FACHB-1407]|nr:hypothetical protein [Oscillatoria sp. FACHB-1407]
MAQTLMLGKLPDSSPPHRIGYGYNSQKLTTAVRAFRETPLRNS